MLLNFTELFHRYSMSIKGVIQIGANKGQEVEEYERLGIGDIILIEPCKDAFHFLWNRFGEPNVNMTLINCACGDEEGEFEMFAEHTNQGMSNSLLKPLVHLTQHREVIFDDTEKVNVRKLDNLKFDRSRYNLLNMDVQGFEDRVLRGSVETLPYMDYIYTEVNRHEMYEKCAMITDLDLFLYGQDFERVETGWASETHGWGDSLYIRKSLLK